MIEKIFLNQSTVIEDDPTLDVPTIPIHHHLIVQQNDDVMEDPTIDIDDVPLPIEPFMVSIVDIHGLVV